jgi:hypothetical protein
MLFIFLDAKCVLYRALVKLGVLLRGLRGSITRISERVQWDSVRFTILKPRLVSLV